MLLLLSGASGVGKSTARQLIQERLGSRVEAVELAHLAAIPATPTVSWRQQTAEKAVRRALELRDEGQHLLLAGDPVVPGEILATPSARHLDIAICLLDADEATQTARLLSRGDPDELLPNHLAFAAWLRRHARDPQHMLHVITDGSWEPMRWDRVRRVPTGDPHWRIPIIDSSGLSKDEVADHASRWADSALAGQQPVFRAGWYRLIAPPRMDQREAAGRSAPKRGESPRVSWRV